jgi:hypothetical protein
MHFLALVPDVDIERFKSLPSLVLEIPNLQMILPEAP